MWPKIGLLESLSSLW